MKKIKNHLKWILVVLFVMMFYEVAEASEVSVNVYPQPTGVWERQFLSVYVMNSGDETLIAGSTKKYEITGSPQFPAVLTNDLPSDQKVTLNLIGENYLHVQYTLADSSKISVTAGPYLIDTGSVGSFEMNILDSIGNEVTDWTDESVELSISDPLVTSISGYEKQYRIENYHTEWQTYTPGTVIHVGGDNRIFGRIINRAGASSELLTLQAKIDQLAPVIEEVNLEITEENTYHVSVSVTDTQSGVKEVILNDGTKLLQNGKKYSLSGLTTKPTSVKAIDMVGNQTIDFIFASEPSVSFTAPYTLATPLYRNDVTANFSGGSNLSYKIGNKLYSCNGGVCSATISQNVLLTIIHQDGNKQTTKRVKISNIDKTELQLLLRGVRDNITPTKMEFSWNYSLASGILHCNEGGTSQTHNVTGTGEILNGQNFTYNCYLEGSYGGENLTSNRVMIYPDSTVPQAGEVGISELELDENIYIEESSIGNSYFINIRSHNFKGTKVKIPQNSITSN